MMRFDAWYFPDGETHLPGWMQMVNQRVDGRLTYQKQKYAAVLAACRGRGVAVDVGAHVGLWTFLMARDFSHVHAFEPREAHRECWFLNLQHTHNVAMYPYALGAQTGRVALVSAPESSGDTHVVLDAADADVEMRTLDSFGLQEVDLLKIDTEGHEVFVLEGGIETLRRCRPTVIVEQKPGHAQRFGRGETEAVPFLEALGARQMWCQSGDYVMAFPEVH